MPNVQRTISIDNFLGIDEKRKWNSDRKWTSDLDNVIVRDGKVIGRLGINEWDGITTAETDTPIIGHAAFYRVATQTVTLLRFSPTKVKVWNDAGNSWDDVTGTALTGTSTTRPQSAVVGESDFIVFTNEGEDRPRKYTGTGNTATLGGTPPFAKALEFWKGFLALGNISSDGTTFEPLTVALSDDPDNIWSECGTVDGTYVELVLNESPGDIIAMKVLGEALMVYKTDAIIEVRFSGGISRFSRYKLDFSQGILAPLSLQAIGGEPSKGHIFLAQDRNLYMVQGRQVRQLPNNVQKSLRETMTMAKAPFVRSAVDIDSDVYMLFYQRVGSSFMDGVIYYNYATGEFYRDIYPVEFNAAQGFRASQTTEWKVIASSSTLTYEMGTTTDDNGTAVSREYFVDWTNFGAAGNKWLNSVEMTFTRARDCRVKVSVAVDRKEKYSQPRFFSLQGKDADDTQVRVDYKLRPSVFGTWFKLKLEFFQDATSQVELLQIEPEVVIVHPTSDDNAKEPKALTT